MTARPSAPLCDANGNLFPSEEPAFEASTDVTNEFLATLGVDERYTPEGLRLATTGKNFRTTVAELASTSSAPLTDEQLERWVGEEQRRVTAYLATGLQPDPAVLEPLDRLGRGSMLAAVSSSSLDQRATCFTATGLEELIPADRRYSAEDSLPAPTSKPDPAVHLYACQQLGVAPAGALAVEDSNPGTLSAVRAGPPTVGNLQFVPRPERPERATQLRAAAVVALVASWDEMAGLHAERAS